MSNSKSGGFIKIGRTLIGIDGSVIVTPMPTPVPTYAPTPLPTTAPTALPTQAPTSLPSGHPTYHPSGQPTSHPSGQPTAQPSGEPTWQPTTYPSWQPTSVPSGQPSVSPTSLPSSIPSGQPTSFPSGKPSGQPTGQPTEMPSSIPSSHPSGEPSNIPSSFPSSYPSAQPTSGPSSYPSSMPSGQPTSNPIGKPSGQPTGQPTEMPSSIPSSHPSGEPTSISTIFPTSYPSAQPTSGPSSYPSSMPSGQPTSNPTGEPSGQPTGQPTEMPSSIPSSHPSGEPSNIPTSSPSSYPSGEPTSGPSSYPSSMPSGQPTSNPTEEPSEQPTGQPTSNPSHKPTLYPTPLPTLLPTVAPSLKPTIAPSIIPTHLPTKSPSLLPTLVPTIEPTHKPTKIPTISPSVVPTIEPTLAPSTNPTIEPTPYPTQNNFGTFPTNEGISVISNSSTFKVVMPYRQGIYQSVGDGFYDVIVTDPAYATNYVIFGKNGLSNNINLANVSHHQGFSYPKAISYDDTGRSVDFIDDFNGDGYRDLVIGNPFVKYNTGYAYVVMGDVDGITQAKYGFTIFGSGYGAQFGWSVANAGDFNGDGLSDIIIGSPSDSRSSNRAGGAYLIFGKQSGFSNINVASLSITQGFAIFGPKSYDYLGVSVSSAGDVNNDGFDDVIIGGYSSENYSAGQAYVVFGKSSDFSNIYLGNLNNTQGFVISNFNAYEQIGFSVGSCGDINGDGFDDVVVGGVKSSRSGISTSYVVYGKLNNITNINLANLDKTQGFKITGGGAYVGKAGDVNNDGISDFIIGADYSTGALSFVIFPPAQSHEPTGMPSGTPTTLPSSAPSVPTSKPTSIPTKSPIVEPTSLPTSTPTIPTGFPTSAPTLKESKAPTFSPTGEPTSIPTNMPLHPTSYPTIADTAPTGIPSSAPSNPTKMPTSMPTAPTLAPTIAPTPLPTEHPTLNPIFAPTKKPTKAPTTKPILLPSVEPTKAPTLEPTFKPSLMPTMEPTTKPTSTKAPTVKPTVRPTKFPTLEPTSSPTGMPTSSPTNNEQTPYETITLTEGGSYTGSTAKEEFILDSINDIVITSSGGEDKFVIKSHQDAQYIITDFNPQIQSIDLKEFTHIHKFSDLDIQLGSIIINLPDNQVIRLLNLTPSDITQDNFVFAPDSKKDGLVATTLMIGIPCVAIIGMIIYVYKTHQDDKQDIVYPDDEFELSEKQIKLANSVSKKSRKKSQILPQESAEKPYEDEPTTSISNSNDIEHGSKEGTTSHSPKNEYEQEDEAINQIGLLFDEVSEGSIKNPYIDNDDDSTITVGSKDFYKIDSNGLSYKSPTRNQVSDLKPNIPKIIQSRELDDVSSLGSVEYSEAVNMGSAGSRQSPRISSNGDDQNSVLAVSRNEGLINSNQNQLELEDYSSAFNSKESGNDIQILLVYDIKYDDAQLNLLFKSTATVTSMSKIEDQHSKNALTIIHESTFVDPISYKMDYLKISLFIAKQTIVYLPSIKYFAKETAYPVIENYLPETIKNITLPSNLVKIIDHKAVHFAAHYSLGIIEAYLTLPENAINLGIIAATASSTKYGVRLSSSEIVTYFYEDIKYTKTSYELLTKFGCTTAVYTMLNSGSCMLFKTAYPNAICEVFNPYNVIVSSAINGAQIYLEYKADHQVIQVINEEELAAPLIFDVVTPAIAEVISLVVACRNLNIGYGNHFEVMNSYSQVMRAMSIGVATDYIAKAAVDLMPREIKESYLEPVFIEMHEIYEYCTEGIEKITGSIKWLLNQNEEL